MKVYVSGKMSGLPNFGFDNFNRAAASLRASGYDVVNPAELDAQDAGPMEWHEYLRRDIAHLVTCDAIALLPNFIDSKGAKLEKHIAEQLGMRVIYITQEPLIAKPAKNPAPNRAKGGRARAANLTPERRREIASAGGKARALALRKK